MTKEKTFDVVLSGLRREGIPCVLIGGFALGFHNFARVTSDIDFLISEKDAKRAIEILQASGFALKEENKDLFVRFASKNPDLIDVDFVFVEPATLQEVIKDGKEVTSGSITLMVPSLRHLIALKLHAIKNNRHRELKDLLDIVTLIRTNKLDFKSAEFKAMCLKYGTEETYGKITNALSES